MCSSTVLLKSTKHTLPLDVDAIKKLGVFGEDAAPNPAGINADIPAGGNHGTLTQGWGSGTANAPYVVDPWSAIRKFVARNNAKASVKSVLTNTDSSAATKLARQVYVCCVLTEKDRIPKVVDYTATPQSSLSILILAKAF